ncbi:CidA/LrgA family protein [Tissierella sp. P1]|jgi:holin-like protein|uniref:CidA/LrgA family protein n=1 Tax=Tissierella TaxID=41273 RepID=UPI000BA1144C|nr:CidA/LrgA family protein [Tissierella sp. P1]MDU5082445.1 CidA/LrgA family protein [Bacillota bacterium]OZV14123.1 CidA/LrgA family protein [Tissierella sp. P1]
MKILKELAIIVGILFIAHITQQITKIPIPATVLGMIILLICLLTGIVKLEKIETVSKFFLDHLTFLFIPGGVGLIASLDLIKEQWIPILAVIILTTALVIAVTGLTVQSLKGRRKEEMK